MNRNTLFAPLALTILILTATSASQAQRMNLSAREAIGLVSSQFGPQPVQWIAEMRAQGGIPQPSDWEILAYDERSPRLLYRFWAGGGRAGDGGMDELRYPDDVPVGYFNASQIGVDSVAAFTIAEGEARRARMAFDSCDYLLRVREYSSEPLWRLELLDASRRIVGKLYISATNGQVLRTVWVYRDQRARPDGFPLIIDSFAPTGQVPVDPGLSSVDSLAPGQDLIMTPPAYQDQTGIAATAPSGPQPYMPVSPSGSPVDDGIPLPPPITQSPAPAPAPAPPVAVAPAPAPSAPVAPVAPAEPDPTKPPITAPSSGGGNSDRIPPPPIPR